MCPVLLEPVLAMDEPLTMWNFIRRLGETGVIKVGVR
jgi:hypothetical protein